MGDSGITVDRWRRYGKDRLYVHANDGEKVGWWDLLTDEAHPKSQAHTGTLAEVVADWKATQEIPAKPQDAVVLRPPAPVALAEPVHANPTYAEALSGSAGDLPSELAGHPGLPVLAPNHAAPPQVTATATGDIATVETPARPWLDLAANRPGAEAREQALAARDAAPVKSLLARALRVHTDERAWRIGADGEEKVAAQLAKVAKKDPRWRFLHAIPVGDRGSDIDHLVIGPGGVFTVNAKHHPRAKIWVGGDTFMVNGNKQPYIRNSRHEAARAAKLLSAACGFPVHVEGIIVTVNAEDIVIKKAPAAVHVVPRMQIARWLRRHGEIHASADLEAIYEAARRSTTWQP